MTLEGFLIGLSSYLLLIGIYSSVISVAEDSKLRQSIRNYAIKESRLLDSIGTAEMRARDRKKSNSAHETKSG